MFLGQLVLDLALDQCPLGDKERFLITCLAQSGTTGGTYLLELQLKIVIG